MLTVLEINGSILPSTHLCEQRVAIGIVKVDKGSFVILGWGWGLAATVAKAGAAAVVGRLQRQKLGG